MARVGRHEWRWVGAFAAGVLAFSLLPYVLAFAEQGTGWRFSGFLVGVEDGNSYIAKMRAGAEGAWLYRLAYTTEPQNGALVFLPYLLLGKLAAGPALHTQLVALFHLARLLAGLGMVFATYRFLAHFVTDISLRRFGLLLGILGGGLGWVGLLLRPAMGASEPLEFYSPESFGFLSLFTLPHLAAARALLLLALVWFLEALQGADRHGGWKAGLALAALWFFQPLNAVIAWAVMGTTAVLLFARQAMPRSWGAGAHAPPGLSASSPGSWRGALTQAVRAVAISAPFVIYSALAFTLDPVLRQWTAQNLIRSPAPVQYLMAYGLMLLLAVPGGWLAWRSGDPSWTLPIGWLLILPALVYAPVNLQRRLAEGVWVAFVALAIYGLSAWRSRDASWRPRGALVALGALSLPSTLLLFVSSLQAATQPAAPVFLPAGAVSAFAWLDANAKAGSVILTDYPTGNALPAYASVVPYVGHGPETLHLQAKLEEVEAFFDPRTPEAERVRLLEATGARYVLAPPSPGSAAEESALAAIPGLVFRLSDAGWRVYEFTGESEQSQAGEGSPGTRRQAGAQVPAPPPWPDALE